jgi:D-serine dehydratase
MSRALASVTWFSELERVPGGGWQGVLSLAIAGVVVGLKVLIEEVQDERKYRNAKMRGWVYIVAASPEDAAQKIESARRELDQRIAARIKPRF